MKNFKTWIYHKTEEPKIIDQHETEKYFKDGWADSPARFMEFSENLLEAQNTLDSVKGVKDSLNDSLNVDSMTKKQLITYAKNHFGSHLEKRENRGKLLATVKGLIGLSGGGE